MKHLDLERNIEVAARLIRSGKLVVFPTETVYGLGGDATNPNAIASIYQVKGRPSFNPLIIHVSSIEIAEKLVKFSEQSKALAEHFWPGALTLVLPRSQNCPVSLLAGSGLETLAIRIPENEIALNLLRRAQVPIAAPSANKSGSVSPTTANHVRNSLRDDIDLIIDGGACKIGVESTIIDMSAENPCLLRAGGIPLEDFEREVGNIQILEEGQQVPKAPGMLPRHYATQIPLRINAKELHEGEALLAFGSRTLGNAVAVCNLSRTGDLNEAAANLFDMMRQLDKPEFTGIAVMEIPEVGLGRAINDRLRRASY
tara:strand:+ start:10341 stop:11282 length:942 start_codon:yes stop_codon:yes gene_type:complete